MDATCATALAVYSSTNYTLTVQSPAPATITPKALTMSGLSVPTSKVYDGTNAIAVTGTPALPAAEAPGSGTVTDGNPYSGDTIGVTGTAAGAFADKAVGAGRPASLGAKPIR